MRAHHAPAVLLLLCLAVATGCTSQPEPTVPSVASITPSPRPSPAPRPAPEPGPTTPPARPPATPEPRAASECAATTRSLIEATLTTQLDAFAVDDLVTAYAMTSPFFRTFVDGDAFDTLIRGEHPELLGNGGHRFDECRTLGRRAFIIVGVRADDGEVVLRYDLSEEPDGWRIDGARTLDGVVLPTDPLV